MCKHHKLSIMFARKSEQKYNYAVGFYISLSAHERNAVDCKKWLFV